MARLPARPHASLRRRTLVVAASAAACLALAGCGVTRTAFGPLQYDKASPAAGVIASTSVENQPYPSFRDVPSQPTDVRPTAAWSRNIFDVLAARRQMEAFQVAQPQTLYGAEAFAQQSRAEATPPPLGGEARARATPPSPAR